MKKSIQLNFSEVTFKCASCGSECVVESALKQDLVSIDVCSNCHPFYKGESNTKKTKDSDEKLSSKLDADKNNLNKKITKSSKKVTKKSNKVINSLYELK